MSVVFVRLFDGRLWHVVEALGHTACGRDLEWDDVKHAKEVLEGRVPDGAWVCARCVRELSVRACLARQALRNDPRRVKPRVTEPSPVHPTGEDEEATT